MAEALDPDRLVRFAAGIGGRRVSRRNDRDLPFASEETIAGGQILPDTCVYIDELKGRLPSFVSAMLQERISVHSGLVIAELAFAMGRLDPADPRTRGAVTAIAEIIASMRPHRISSPNAETLARGGILAGVLARLGGYGQDQRRRAIVDCQLFLQARKSGLTLVTRNIGDFDLLSQLVPDVHLLLYRVP